MNEKFDLTNIRFKVLRIVAKYSEEDVRHFVNQEQVARDLSITRATANAHIRDLLAAGYISKKRRFLAIEITEAGKKAVKIFDELEKLAIQTAKNQVKRGSEKCQKLEPEFLT